MSYRDIPNYILSEWFTIIDLKNLKSVGKYMISDSILENHAAKIIQNFWNRRSKIYYLKLQQKIINTILRKICVKIFPHNNIHIFHKDFLNIIMVNGNIQEIHPLIKVMLKKNYLRLEDYMKILNENLSITLRYYNSYHWWFISIRFLKYQLWTQVKY